MLRRVVVTSALASALLLGFTTDASAQGIEAGRAYVEGQAGWAAIRNGQYDAAATHFAAALVTEPREATLHLGAATASYLLGRGDESQASLERALVLSPQLTPASVLLSDLLTRNNELLAAMDVLEKALVHAPGVAVLVERLARVRKESELHRTFFQSQGAHFTVLFEGPADEQLARRAIEVLEAAYWRIGTALLTFPSRVIAVVLYTEQQFSDITRSPAWAAGAYDGRIKVPVRGALRNPDELDRVLTHEFTHALVQSIAPRGVPTWLNEGLAVYFEPNGEAWTDAQMARGEYHIPLNQLANGFGRLSAGRARMAYAESGAAVRTLMNQAGPQAMTGLLLDLGRGDTFDTAFERRMLQPYDSFIASLDPAR